MIKGNSNTSLNVLSNECQGIDLQIQVEAEKTSELKEIDQSEHVRSSEVERAINVVLNMPLAGS